MIGEINIGHPPVPDFTRPECTALRVVRYIITTSTHVFWGVGPSSSSACQGIDVCGALGDRNSAAGFPKRCSGRRPVARMGGRKRTFDRLAIINIYLSQAPFKVEEAPSALLLGHAALLSARRHARRRAALWYFLAAHRLEKCGIVCTACTTHLING
jgi:hypothetical protein